MHRVKTQVFTNCKSYTLNQLFHQFQLLSCVQSATFQWNKAYELLDVHHTGRFSTPMMLHMRISSLVPGQLSHHGPYQFIARPMPMTIFLRKSCRTKTFQNSLKAEIPQCTWGYRAPLTNALPNQSSKSNCNAQNRKLMNDVHLKSSLKTKRTNVETSCEARHLPD